MAIELKVPEVGESITEVMIGVWKKNVGDTVSVDEVIVEIESDKATVELPAPSNGVVTKIVKQAGEQAVVGEVIGYLDAVSSASQLAPVTTPEVPASQQTQSVDVRHRVGSTVIGSVQPAAGTGPVMPAAAKNVGRSWYFVSVNFWQWSWPASHKSGCHLCGIGIDSSVNVRSSHCYYK